MRCDAGNSKNACIAGVLEECSCGRVGEGAAIDEIAGIT